MTHNPVRRFESWVRPWFKPLAYACILLRDNVLPCVFFGDYYGVPHDLIPPIRFLPHMVWIRAHLLGDQVEAQLGDTAHSLCWVVEGKSPVCVVLNTGDDRDPSIDRFAMRRSPSHTLIDVCHPDAPATTDTQGQGNAMPSAVMRHLY